MSEEQAERVMALGGPLKYALFLFDPPAGMTAQDARRKALKVLGVGLGLMVIVYAGTPLLMRLKEGGQTLMPVILVLFGSAFLLVPAALFRLIFGVVSDDSVSAKMGRWLVAVILFGVTSIGSCLLYGQVNP